MEPWPGSVWRYTLSDDEAEFLDDLARKRKAFWDERRVRTSKVTARQSDLEIHRVGAYGEYGASRILDYPFNDQWDRPDRGHDLQKDGFPSIQVKSTATYYRGEHYIFFRKADRFISDIVLQAHVEGRTISLVGWASRRRFWHKHEMKDFGAGHGLQPALHERFWGSMLAFPVMPVRLEGCPEAE